MIESFVAVGGTSAPAVRPRANPTPPPPPPPSSASFLTLSGDMTVEDHDPDVVVQPAVAAGREPRLRVELRHREGGSSQPDAVVVFLNVPDTAGTYALRSPEDPPSPSRVYAFVTTRGNAVGSMKDFNTAVTGTLTLRREGEALTGIFRLTAQEPPPPPPPASKPGQPPLPQAGTVPPSPPAVVQVQGRLLATLPAPPAPSLAPAPTPRAIEGRAWSAKTPAQAERRATSRRGEWRSGRSRGSRARAASGDRGARETRRSPG